MGELNVLSIDFGKLFRLPELVDHIVDDQAGVTAIPLHHPKEFFPGKCLGEGILPGRLVAARFLEVEESHLVSLFEPDRISDAAVEVEHIEAVGLGRGDLLGREFRRGEDAVDRPEAPTDRRTQDDALSIESHHGIRSDSLG